jgi:uncharacterized RDD family membrane protein YckC
MENQPQQPTAVKTPVGEVHYAGGWIRFLSFIIDAIIIGIVNQIVLATGIGTSTAQNINSIITLAYFVIMIAVKQQTVGMMALSLKIVSASGEKTNWWGIALLREIVGRIVCSLTLGIGYLIIFWTKKKQGLHDMIAKTYVIRTK